MTPIAVIGTGAVFADSENLLKFWENIVEGKDCIRDVPANRWSIKDYYDPDPTAPDKTYCKRGGFIPDIDFNPMEFGLPPNILEVTDTSQLLSLLVAGETLEDAEEGWRAFHAISRDLGKATGPEAHFKLLKPQPLVFKVLDTAGFTKVLLVFEDEATAVASFE